MQACPSPRPVSLPIWRRPQKSDLFTFKMFEQYATA